MPQWISDLGQNENWKPIKDEIRLIKKNLEQVNAIPAHGSKSADCAYRPLAWYVNDTDLKIHVNHGMAWFMLKKYDWAGEAFRLLQGHIWEKERLVLQVWILRLDGDCAETIHGPTDATTGKLLPPPVPRSQPSAGIVPTPRERAMSMTSRPELWNGNIGTTFRALPPQLNPYVSPVIPGSLYQNIGARSAISTQSSGSGHFQHLECQNVVPQSPGLTMSSTNSSISTLSTSVVARPGHIVLPAFHSAPTTTDTPFPFRNTSVSSISQVLNVSTNYAQAPTSPTFVSKKASLPQTLALPSTGFHQVTIQNLSLQTTKEMVCDLVEKKTSKYVTLVQPEPIKLRKCKGQLHAYVNFVQKDDAEKAVRGLQGLSYKGKKLHALLNGAAPS